MFYSKPENANSFLYKGFYKERVMATRMPNSISFYYTSNESLLNNSSSIKYVLMYTKTHLTWSNVLCMLRCDGMKAV